MRAKLPEITGFCGKLTAEAAERPQEPRPPGQKQRGAQPEAERPSPGNLAALRFGWWNALAPPQEPRPCGRQTQREEQLPE